MLDVRRDRQTASIILTHSLARIVVRSPWSTGHVPGPFYLHGENCLLPYCEYGNGGGTDARKALICKKKKKNRKVEGGSRNTRRERAKNFYRVIRELIESRNFRSSNIGEIRITAGYPKGMLVCFFFFFLLCFLTFFCVVHSAIGKY